MGNEVEMPFFDYFRTAATWTPETLRRYLDEHQPGDYQLLDVRQPGEYLRGHLPGAVLIPVGELENRLDELDPATLTVAY